MNDVSLKKQKDERVEVIIIGMRVQENNIESFLVFYSESVFTIKWLCYLTYSETVNILVLSILSREKGEQLITF